MTQSVNDNSPPVTEEWLRNRVVENNWSCTEVALSYNTDRATVRKWIEYYDLSDEV